MIILEILLVIVFHYFSSKYLDQKFGKSKLLDIASVFAFLGGVVIFFSYFFDAPVMGLSYGVQPVFHDSEAGIGVGLFLILTSVFLFFVFALTRK